MTPARAALAASALVLGAVAACTGSGDVAPREAASPAPAEGAGSADTGTYCHLLATDLRSVFARARDAADVRRAVQAVEGIAAAAPAEVLPAWRRLSDTLTTMESALLEVADLEARAAAGTVGPVARERRRERLMREVEALDTPANDRDTQAVLAHAEKHCDEADGDADD